jgi:hypothetical protein
MVVVNPDSLIDLCYCCRRCARRLFGCDAFTRAISIGQSIHSAATAASCLLWLESFGHG